MNAANDIAAIRARLPYFDRRALSQAWFSAFHLVAGDGAASFRHAFALAEAAPDPAAPAAVKARTHRPAASAPAARAASRGTASVVASGGSSGSRRSERRERPVPQLETPLRYPPLRAAFTLTIEGARVQILLRREGSELHVIALCSRRHLELVRRALACADFALRAQGACVRSSLRAAEVAG